MAGDAGEHGKIIGIGVAIRAGCPRILMAAGIDREIRPIMIEGRRCPGRGSVAGQTGGGEMRRLMIGIGRAVVVRLMAVIAIRRRALILPVDVAQVAGQAYVRSGQRKAGVIMIEGGRIPRVL